MSINDMAKAARRSTPDVDIPSHQRRRFSQPTPEYSKSHMEKFNDPDFKVGGSRDFENDIMQRQRTDFSRKNKAVEDAEELERMKAENVKNELERLRKEENFKRRERNAKIGTGLFGLLITGVGIYLKRSTWRKMFGDIPGTVQEIVETVKTVVKCIGGKDPNEDEDSDEHSCTEAVVRAVVPVILFFIIFILFLNYFRPK